MYIITSYVYIISRGKVNSRHFNYRSFKLSLSPDIWDAWSRVSTTHRYLLRKQILLSGICFVCANVSQACLWSTKLCPVGISNFRPAWKYFFWPAWIYFFRPALLADCPAMSFVFVYWHSRKWWPPIREIDIRNTNQLSWAINYASIGICWTADQIFVHLFSCNSNLFTFSPRFNSQ